MDRLGDIGKQFCLGRRNDSTLRLFNFYRCVPAINSLLTLPLSQWQKHLKQPINQWVSFNHELKTSYLQDQAASSHPTLSRKCWKPCRGSVEQTSVVPACNPPGPACHNIAHHFID